MILMKALRTFRGDHQEGLVAKGDRFQTTAHRAELHEDAGRAVRVQETSARKDQTPSGQTTEKRPDGVRKRRRWEQRGAWKALFEGGTEVESVRCSKEEADAWVRGEVGMHELKE